jgi:hypothetical protein
MPSAEVGQRASTPFGEEKLALVFAAIGLLALLVANSLSLWIPALSLCLAGIGKHIEGTSELQHAEDGKDAIYSRRWRFGRLLRIAGGSWVASFGVYVIARVGFP